MVQLKGRHGQANRQNKKISIPNGSIKSRYKRPKK